MIRHDARKLLGRNKKSVGISLNLIITLVVGLTLVGFILGLVVYKSQGSDKQLDSIPDVVVGIDTKELQESYKQPDTEVDNIDNLAEREDEEKHESLKHCEETNDLDLSFGHLIINNECQTDYLIVAKEDSKFLKEANYFARNKRAHFLTYKNHISELRDDVRSYKYFSIVSEPEYLEPEFMLEVDNFATSLDNDIYYDIVFSYITSRDNQNLKNYMDRLINYEIGESQILSLGASNAFMLKSSQTPSISSSQYLKVNQKWGGNAISVGEEVTDENLKENLKTKNILFSEVHGLPSGIDLGTNEPLTYYNNSFDLAHFESCLAGRINGDWESEYGTKRGEHPGRVSSSFTLDLVEKGTLNIISFFDIGVSGFSSSLSLQFDLFYKNKTIGESLFDYKNTLKSNILLCDRDLCDGDIETIKGLLNHVSSVEVLFGDPTIRITSEENIKGEEFFKCNYQEKVENGKYYVNITKNFRLHLNENDFFSGYLRGMPHTNEIFVRKVQKISDSEYEVGSFSSSCFFITEKINKKAKDISLVSAKTQKTRRDLNVKYIVIDRNNENPLFYVSIPYLEELGEHRHTNEYGTHDIPIYDDMELIFDIG